MKVTNVLRNMASFRALVARTKKTPAQLETLTLSDLPALSDIKRSPGICNTIVRVKYSNLNYKDAMVVLGTYPGLKLPMIPGIDLAGIVESTSSESLKPGDAVLINGFGIGTDHFGGYAEKASVREDWLMPLPLNMSLIDAARIGTAGYTAMLCIDALLKDKVSPESGPVLVTGASGGVGSIAVAILSEMGYTVVAVTGKPDPSVSQFLTSLGAASILPRSHFETDPKPLAKETYAGCIDTIGGVVLSNVLSLMKYEGSVAACGLAGGMAMKGCTVAPFILRGVNLRGIESAFRDMSDRTRIYNELTPILLKSKKLDHVTSGSNQIIGLDQVMESAQLLMEGKVKGRFVVQLS